ncbi:MAG: hypothetical protein Q9218_000005 [Villophora microphyllina]
MKRSMTVAENKLQRFPIISRFNLPTVSKTPRNVSEYAIELEDPYRTFAPGDRIRGHVILNVERPVRITHLTICLHGVVKVLKNGRVSGESSSRWRSYLATGQGKWGEAYFGNGLAALFKDEIILAGDGCLSASSYKFEFDLELPTHGLPSSIDVGCSSLLTHAGLTSKQFQHGSISYMLSSILTRPTTLSPTSRCERSIPVRETIDVADLPQPVAQVIPLEMIHRRPRRTKTAVISQKSGCSKSYGDMQSQAPVGHSSTTSQVSDESPQSPSVSDISCTSTVSSSRANHESASVLTIGHGSGNLDGYSVASSDEATTSPSATVEMLQSGCLPGDTVSVRVAINLTKHFKNPEGIILTLYRECHIDIHPAIPLGSWQTGKKQEYEDYYPKSRTGLGGLSLSSGGSSRVFRQDISQQSTALYVDKQTLCANVKASLHVPEALFPTISSVPGAMVDFKYYVETIIDLRGKSAIQEHILPRLSMVNSVPSLSRSESRFNSHKGYDGVKFPLGSGVSFLETSQIRRERGVVTHVSEVVVGTRDSGRNRLKKIDYNRGQYDIRLDSHDSNSRAMIDEVDEQVYEFSHFTQHDNANVSHSGHIEDHTINCAPAHSIPPSEIENHVDEKTRLQRAEALLLPSAPPQDRHPPSQAYVSQGPTAPAGFEEDDYNSNMYQPGPSAPAYDRSASPPHHPGPSTSHPSADAGHLEDKQELERRRLQAQVSSPMTRATMPGVMGPPDVYATAPVLDEEGTAIDHTPQPPREQQSNENLPLYQA